MYYYIEVCFLAYLPCSDLFYLRVLLSLCENEAVFSVMTSKTPQVYLLPCYGTFDNFLKIRLNVVSGRVVSCTYVRMGVCLHHIDGALKMERQACTFLECLHKL